MVGTTGFEPAASRTPSECATNCATPRPINLTCRLTSHHDVGSVRGNPYIFLNFISTGYAPTSLIYIYYSMSGRVRKESNRISSISLSGLRPRPLYFIFLKTRIIFNGTKFYRNTRIFSSLFYNTAWFSSKCIASTISFLTSFSLSMVSFSSMPKSSICSPSISARSSFNFFWAPLILYSST